ncbi:MAG: hypothetical protein IKZ47_02435 [Clostridia bacterium]|nr:hypothetical protein [Clostridia bacterium]
MSKKTISKVIAIVCVMALCLTAVFTGAVFADTHTATATVTGAAYYQGDKASYVSAEVTFTSADAFTAGSFTFSATGLTLIDCSTATEGFHIYVNPANSKVLFAGFSESATPDIVSATSLTLVAKFTINDGALANKAAGTAWTVTAGSITITNTVEESYTCSNASGTIHVHDFNGDTTTTGNVTTHACSVAGCSEVETEISDTGSLTTNALADTKKAVLSFTNDGDTVLNALVPKSAVDAYQTVYFTYSYQTNDDLGNNVTETATSTKSGVMNDGGTDYYVFPCGRNGGVGRMGRPITGNFIAVAAGGATTISDKWEYSVKQYLEALISDGTAAEKNYAKSLWNFGKYTAEFAGLADSFGDAKTGVADWTLPTSKAAVATGSDDTWTLSKVSVTTGYKPKMNLRFDTTGLNATVKVYDSGELVYSKEVALTGDTLTVSDIPTKYLTGDIEIGVKNSAKTISYSFGKYAKARSTKSDAAVFQWMMNYAYYLNQAFA